MLRPIIGPMDLKKPGGSSMSKQQALRATSDAFAELHQVIIKDPKDPVRIAYDKAYNIFYQYCVEFYKE